MKKISFLMLGIFLLTMIAVQASGDFCNKIVRGVVKVGTEANQSICAARAFNLSLTPSGVVSSVYCVGIYKGVPIFSLKVGGILYYATEVKGKMYRDFDWVKKCPEYVSSPNFKNGKWTIGMKPLTMGEVKKCIKEGKNLFAPFYDETWC